MIHVLRHYLPLRKTLLIASETVLLTLVVALVMSSHLRGRDTPIQVIWALANDGLDPDQAILRCWVSAFLVSVLAQVAISFNELYDFRVSSSRYDRAARFLGSAASAILLVVAAVVLTRTWHVRGVLAFPGVRLTQRVVLLSMSLGAGFGLLYLWRALFHLLLRRWNFNERVMILGSGKPARALTDELRGRLDTGYEVVGIVSRQPTSRSDGGAPPAAQRFLAPTRRRGPSEAVPAAPSAPAGGALALRRRSEDRGEEDTSLFLRTPDADGAWEEETDGAERVEGSLFDLVQRLRVDDVVVALEDRRGVLPTDDLLRCRLTGVVVEEGEAFFERVTGKIAVGAMRPSYLIFNPGFVQHPFAELVKRGFDLFAAVVGLALAWPVMLVVALVVRLDSPGPALFRQERTGRHGKPFTLCKFRSMRADAEKLSGPVWATQDDPRVTRIGRFLRKSRLDELPQLFNVLLGDMSLVGPRPERPHFVDELAEEIPYFYQRHIVKPGLTGWAQINYPYGNTVEDALQKLQYDLFYIKYQSMLFDLSILFNTVKTVVLRKGT